MNTKKPIFTRRQFIKTTAFAAMTVNSVVGFFEKAFGQDFFDEQIIKKLNLTGIFPNPADIGKPGIHLRWIFALEKGFPDSFKLYKAESKDNSKYMGIKPHTTLNYGYSSTGDTTRIQFRNRVEYVYLFFKSERVFPVTFSLDSTIKSRQVVTPQGNGYVVEFQGSNIDSIEYTKDDSSVLISGKFIEEGACCRSDWDQIAEIKFASPLKDFEANSIKFFQNYYNFYLPLSTIGINIIDRLKAIQRYRNNIKNYKDLLRALQHGNSYSVKKNSITGEDEATKLKRDWNRVLSILFLSISDPNIARILGLYFVDDAKINNATKYDYRIEAVYTATNIDCACLYNIGKEYDPLPVVKASSTSSEDHIIDLSQKNSSDFLFNEDIKYYEQHGAIELTWPKPVSNAKTNPYNYFLVKIPDRHIRLEKEKRFNNSWRYKNYSGRVIQPSVRTDDNLKYSYTDHDVLVEKITYLQEYRLAGIDLFGRIGEFLKESLDIKDQSIPTPPTNLTIIQNNNKDKHFLRFNYGSAQYLKSPDALTFRLYKKEHTLNNKQKIKFSTTAIIGLLRHTKTGEYSHRVFTVHIEDDFAITNPDGTNIADEIIEPSNFRFTTFHIVEDSDNQPLPAADRGTYRITKVIDGKSFQIITERDGLSQLPSGYGYLNVNKGNPKLWTSTGLQLSASVPLNLKLIDNVILNPPFPEGDKHLIAKVIGVKVIPIPSDNNSIATIKNSDQRKDIDWKLLQKSVHQDTFSEKDLHVPTEEATELILNRAIYESGIFNDGTLITRNGTQHNILAQASVYSTVGSGLNPSRRVSKILIKGNVAIGRGDLVGLTIKGDNLRSVSSGNTNSVSGFIKLYFTSPKLPLNKEGTVLLPAKIFDQNETTQEQEIPVTARLMSDIRKPGPNYPYEALLFLSRKVKKIITHDTKAFFFPTYQMEITPYMHIDFLRGKGTASSYFALTTLDNSDQQNESALSLPIQNISYLNTPPPKPTSVYLRGLEQPEKIYLSLPNKEGRSTIALQWDDLNNDNWETPIVVRYELARALDVSIISALKAKWMSGDPPHEHPPVMDNTPDLTGIVRNPGDAASALITIPEDHVSYPINLTGIHLDQGVYRGQFNPVDGFDDTVQRKFTGGRINIGKFYFAVTGFLSPNIILLRLLTQPQPGEIVPTASGIQLSILKFPDLDSEIIKDILYGPETNRLKQIAGRCPEAFSMTTKVPVRENRFLDSVPGQGNGKYFYKVRSVDAAENRSDWSDCSNAVYQVDSIKPSEIKNLRVIASPSSHRLFWSSIIDKTNMDGVRIFRKEANSQTIVDVLMSSIKKMPINMNRNKIILPTPISLNYLVSENEASVIETIRNSIKVEEVDIADSLNYFDIDTGVIDYKVILSDQFLTIIITGLSNLPDAIDNKNLKVSLMYSGETTIIENNQSLQYFLDESINPESTYEYQISSIKKVRYLSNNDIKETDIFSSKSNSVTAKLQTIL